MWDRPIGCFASWPCGPLVRVWQVQERDDDHAMTDLATTRTIDPDAAAVPLAGAEPRPARRCWEAPMVEDVGIWSATGDKHTAPREQSGAESAKDGS